MCVCMRVCVCVCVCVLFCLSAADASLECAQVLGTCTQIKSAWSTAAECTSARGVKLAEEKSGEVGSVSDLLL